MTTTPVAGTHFTGTARLVRMALRRDRLMASIWGTALVGVCYASAAATASLYANAAEQVAAAESFNSTPAIVALYGPILDVHSLGEIAMTKMTVLYAVFVAALAITLVRRHTRTEEEGGQAELLGGTAVGRDAPFASATLEAIAVVFVVGVATAAVNILGGLPVAGSIAFGASWFGVGLVGAAIGIVSCQLSASSRTCGAIAASVIGAAFAIRAVGDTSAHWLSWLSPFGWSTQLRSYSETRWWVLGLYAVLSASLIATGLVLRSHRDLGSGLIAARPGAATASVNLRDVITLAIRVQKSTVLTWSAATAVMGALMGAIVPNVSDLLDSDAAREMMARLGGEGAIEGALIAAELSVSAVAVSCFGVAVFARSAADEEIGRTELVLATGTSRSRSFTAAALVAFLGATWLLVLSGLAMALGYGATSHDLARAFGDVLPATLAQAPAVFVTIAIAAAIWALRASWTVASWVVVALFVTLGQVGELLNLPDWSVGLSPYTHTPALPVESFSLTPAMVLVATAAAVVAAAHWRYRSRDIG